MASTGDKSFEAVALPHLDTVYRVARRLARDEHEAEDLVQETYYKAYRAFGDFQMREYGVKPWLLKILNNSFLNRKAREKRAPKSVDQQTLARVEAADEDAGPPELNFQNLDQEVKRALEELAPEFRSVLLLWGTMEFSYQEIANMLDVPIGTVMSRLHRARRQLVAALGDFARENRLGQVRSAR